MLSSKHIIAPTTAAIMLGACLVLPGCFGGLSDPVGTSSNGSGGSSSNNANMIQVSQTSYGITRNAVNNMVNGALKFSVTDMQRRPMSTFSGSAISSSEGAGGAVSAAATNDIVVQIDVSYTWNVNTYRTALQNAGTDVNMVPSALKDVLQPGKLMYIQGEDADGNLYQSADVIVPSEQKDVNQLAINAQWDYNVLNSPLPETSVTKTGSFLMRIPSTAKNLKLVFVTPMSGQDVSRVDNISQGNVAVYELPLT